MSKEKTEIKSKQMDMLHGALLKNIILFALPVAATSILQQLFNSADVAVVGRFAGSQAMAAVGGNSSVTSLLINLFVGLSVGANVVIAKYIGQGNKEKVSEVVHTVMLMALVSGIFLLILGVCVARPVLELINTPSDVIELAILYLRIYFLGMPFLMVYNFGSAILRSVGDTKRPMYALLVSGIINVCLNLVFVVIFHMGVVGVGIATVIADIVSALIVVVVLMKEQGMIRLELPKLAMEKEDVIKVVKIGAPAGIQGMVFSLSNVCIQSAINGFGSNAVAGSAAAVNFEFFTYFVTTAFSQATVTFTSQNFGASNVERCKKIFKISIFSGIIGTLIMSMSFILGQNIFIRFYTVDEAVISYGLTRMMHVEILTSIVVFLEVGAAALRGIGYSMLPAVLTVIGSCAFRIVWVYTVFAKVPTFEMLMNVYPASWALTATLVLVAYFIIRKKVFARMVSV